MPLKGGERLRYKGVYAEYDPSALQHAFHPERKLTYGPCVVIHLGGQPHHEVELQPLEARLGRKPCAVKECAVRDVLVYGPPQPLGARLGRYGYGPVACLLKQPEKLPVEKIGPQRRHRYLPAPLYGKPEEILKGRIFGDRGAHKPEPSGNPETVLNRPFDLLRISPPRRKVQEPGGTEPASPPAPPLYLHQMDAAELRIRRDHHAFRHEVAVYVIHPRPFYRKVHPLERPDRLDPVAVVCELAEAGYVKTFEPGDGP